MCHIIKMMKYFDWDYDKNQSLKIERNVSFEEIELAIEDQKILDIVEHHNKTKYENQRVLIIEIDEYAYLVPFVEDEQKIFLKTIIPSRKATKKYLIDRRKQP
jgi:uncharacterized DUF497 family protein